MFPHLIFKIYESIISLITDYNNISDSASLYTPIISHSEQIVI